MPADKLSIQDFAAKIKEQHPEYKDVNDTVLAQKIADKYPQYRDRVSLPPPISASPVDVGIKKTDQNLNQPLQFNGTFKPDLEGEKKGLYLNDPDYQKQKQEFVSRIVTDPQGNLLYPEKNDKTGKMQNYYTKQEIPNFDPHEMQGKVLQVPHEYLPATGGKKFISPVYNKEDGSYSFPGVETPSTPHEQTMQDVTVYGPKKGAAAKEPAMSLQVAGIAAESDKQGGQFKQVLKNHPELSTDIDNTLKKYGPEYIQSLASGSEGMSNVLQKTVEDKYDLNKPLPANVQPDILNSHLNVLNNFEKNKNEFEANQQELQHQADLITDRAKRTGQEVSPDDVERLAKKASDNVRKWNDYSKSVKFSQNYVQQPEVQEYLNQFKKKQAGIGLMDEIRQRSFPEDTNSEIKQDEYDRKAMEGNLNVLDYIKTGVGAAGKGVSNTLESGAKLGAMMQGAYNPVTQASIEKLNNNAQQFIGSNLPSISPEAIQEMDKKGIGHVVNDVAGTLGGFAPYIIPGAAGEGLAGKAATFATALGESLPTVRKEAEKEGLTGAAYNTYLTAKPLVGAAFMTLLPNAKFAKGFEKDVAESVVNGEFSNPKAALMNLATKALKHPDDIAHLQAMLSGTAMGDALVNKVTNALQAKDDIDKGISRNHELSTELSNVFNPRQTAVMALAGKVLESIPTLKNAIGDARTGKDVQETYDNIQNNLVELAGHNLEGVSKKVDEMLRKDPGNIYAQHLRNTLQDFSYAEARMPEGIEPEQKAALFSIQQKISSLNRQSHYADPVYKPHIQKNIDELNKQIPEILKDEKKANDYLKDAHKDLSESILSPKTEENGKDQTNEAQGRNEVNEKPTEGGKTKSMNDNEAPSFLESRHADTDDDEAGKVSGPNDNPLSKDGKKDANDLAREVEDKGVTKIITSDLERSKQTGNIVAEKTGAKIEHRPELNTWDIGDFDKATDAEFKKAQEYFVKNPDATEFEGKKIKESFNQYKDRVIKARTELENEPASTLVVNHSNNMMLWDAFVKNGHEWNGKAENDYLSSKTPEPATLINKTQNDASKISQSGKDDVGNQSDNGEKVGSGNAESGEPAGESGQPTEKESKVAGKEEPKTVGISHEALSKTAERLGLEQPKPGDVLTPEQYTQRGRELISAGADPEKVASDFKEDGKISADAVGVVKAHDEALVRSADEAMKQFGKESPEFKAAKEAVDKWEKDVAKPMGTEWGRIGRTLVGQTDLDTGSFVSITRAAEKEAGKPLTAEQEKEAKNLSDKVSKLSDEVEGLKQKLTDALDKGIGDKKGGFTEKTKKAADVFRKLKTKEFTFKDSSGNDVPIQKMGVSWNDLVELGAKAIEKTGEIADGIAAILDKVKDIDWYKALSDEDKDRFGKELSDHYADVADRKTASRIKALEKQLEDLQAGKVKEKGAKRIPTEKEKELQDQIFEAKEALGLVKPKAIPKVVPTPIKAQPIAERFVNKKDNKFTPEEAKDVWDYAKTNYVDKGVDFNTMIKNVGTDLGLSADQVMAAITTPKGAKEITVEMFKKQYDRNKAMNAAKEFVAKAGNSKAGNFFKHLPSVFFNLKTYGHGTVGGITHAGANIFRPSVWKAYWPNFIKQFSLAYGNTGKYEMAIQGLKNKPNFDAWLQSGLAVDPNETYDPYQSRSKMSWLGEAGTRGFNALKFMRYDMAEMFYNRASASEKADPELRHTIAELVNHGTGHTEVKMPKVMNTLFFAPGLEFSRWQRMITDPAKAIKTFATWNKSTPADQAAAKIVASGYGQQIGMHMAMLAANAGLLSALGSKQQINFNDPSKSDWLKFKAGGKTIDVTGGVMNPYRLLTTVGREAYLSAEGDKKDLKQKPADKDASLVASQLRYKLAPLPGAAADVLTSQDAMGNTFPWSKVQPGKGKHKMNWFEYASQQTPIPVAAGVEGVLDGMRDQGLEKPQINNIINGLIQFGTEGFTGAKVADDFSLKETPPTGGHRQRQRR